MSPTTIAIVTSAAVWALALFAVSGGFDGERDGRSIGGMLAFKAALLLAYCVICLMAGLVLASMVAFITQ
jgi:Zn-dependent protease with chaperone function